MACWHPEGHLFPSEQKRQEAEQDEWSPSRRPSCTWPRDHQDLKKSHLQSRGLYRVNNVVLSLKLHQPQHSVQRAHLINLSSCRTELEVFPIRIPASCAGNYIVQAHICNFCYFGSNKEIETRSWKLNPNAGQTNLIEDLSRLLFQFTFQNPSPGQDATLVTQYNNSCQNRDVLGLKNKWILLEPHLFSPSEEVISS